MPAPTPEDRCRELVLGTLHKTVRTMVRKGIFPTESLTVRVVDDLFNVLIIVSPSGQCAACPMELECRNHPPDAESDSVRARIIRHLSDEPQSRQKVARLAGCRFNSHFHQVIADLIREETVLDGPDGIRLNASR